MKKDSPKTYLSILIGVILCVTLVHTLINQGIVAVDALLVRSAIAAMLLMAACRMRYELRTTKNNNQMLNILFGLGLLGGSVGLALTAVFATSTSVPWLIGLGLFSGPTVYCMVLMGTLMRNVLVKQ